jgi:hypothetical protein
MGGHIKQRQSFEDVLNDERLLKCEVTELV